MTTNAGFATAPTRYDARLWKLFVLRGSVAVVFGIIAAFWPVETAVTLIVLWGFWAAADGIASLVNVFDSELPPLLRVGHAVLGVIAVGVALLAFTRPELTVSALTWILGIWLIVRGVGAAILAFQDTPRAPRGLIVVGSVVDLILGILFVANPGRSAIAIATVLGLVAIVWGAAIIVAGLVLRHTNTAEQSAPQQPVTDGAPSRDLGTDPVSAQPRDVSTDS